MVSLRKIYRASFVANEFSQLSKTIRSPEPASGSHTLVFAIFDESRLVVEFGSFRISEALLSRGMEIVRTLNIFMDLDSLLTNGDVRRTRVNPSSAIVIVDPVLALMHGGMGVAAENTFCRTMTGMGKRAIGYLRRQALPARAQPVEKSSQGFVFRIPLLQLQIKQRPDQVADANIAHHKAVELVTMDGDMAQALIFPLIFLVHADAH